MAVAAFQRALDEDGHQLFLLKGRALLQPAQRHSPHHPFAPFDLTAASGPGHLNRLAEDAAGNEAK